MITSPVVSDRTRVVLALGTTQTLAWGSSYYLPAILAVPIAEGLSIPNGWVFGAFTAALLLMAAISPWIGREIDRKGGRLVLALSSIVLAVGLVLLALSHGVVLLVVGWLVLGVGMAMGLYDAAFAALAGFYGRSARGPMTGITLIAGFASTVGWPVSAALEARYGWRTACLFWAGVHLLVCLPLNWLVLPRPSSASDRISTVSEGTDAVEEKPLGAEAMRTMWLLAVVFAAGWFVAGAMATHLPRLLQELGASAATAIAASALVGPAQVGARLVEFGLFRNLHPLFSARMSVALHPIAAACLAWWGAPVAALFTVLHGAGNGLLTIARGTLPLALFGATAYGLRQGLLGAPARLTQAGAPFLFGLVLDVSPQAALALSASMMLLALACVLAIRPAAQ